VPCAIALNVRFCLPFTFCCVLLSTVVWKTGAQTPASAAELQVGGAVAAPLKLSSDDLRKMPRVTLGVINPHTQKKETYEGVRVEDLLRKAGVPPGEKMRGPAMASYVVAEAKDGYRVVFSLAELDSGTVDSEVIVADTMDGMPLGENVGPFRIVASREKRPARWVRMLRSLTVVTLPSNPTNKP
jgi:DMSO/TMAO reductase YedYZ molybdopterin-dependent catalytic subunit